MESAVAIFLLASFIIWQTSAQISTLSELDAEFTSIIDAYFDKQSLIPKNDTNSSISVNVEFSLLVIKEVNVDAGQISISGYLTLTWTDERIPALADDIYVMVPASRLWTPTLTLVNGISSAADISASASAANVKYNFNTTEMVWKIWVHQTGACEIDNFYFPFDSHKCTFRYAFFGYAADRLVLSNALSAIDTSGFTETSEWSLTETSSSAFIESSNSYFQFTLTLKRKSTHTALKIVVPSILIALFSSLSLLVPIQTSDRILFSGMSVLIMFLLYLYNSTLVPSSSASVPLILYFLFLEMFFTATVSLLAIASVRVESKPDSDEVPDWLRTIVSCLRCNFYTTERNRRVTKTEVMSLTDVTQTGQRQDPHYINGGVKVKPVSPASSWDDDVYADPDHNRVSRDNKDGGGEVPEKVGKLTWREVGETFDLLFLVLLLVLQICICCGFLIPLALN